jgi:hypothetical protein
MMRLNRASLETISESSLDFIVTPENPFLDTSAYSSAERGAMRSEKILSEVCCLVEFCVRYASKDVGTIYRELSAGSFDLAE